MSKTDTTIFQIGDCVLDLRRGCLSRNEKDIDLRPKSFALLCHMVQHAGRLVPRDELFQTLWPNVVVTDDSLTQCVREVRRALADEAQAILKTVPRRGYVLIAPAESAPNHQTVARVAEAGPSMPENAADAAAGVPPDARAVSAGSPTIGNTLPREIKFVTLLRAQLVETTALVAGLGPEQAHTRLAPAVEAMRRAVGQFRGLVLKELSDGVVAVFGAPQALENHAVLACHAALDLIARVMRLGDSGLRVRAGLHSGSVVSLFTSLDPASGYNLAGAPLFAVEQMQAAADPNGIVGCETCHLLALGYVEFEPLAAQPRDDHSGLARLFRVVGIGSLTSWHVRAERAGPRFVGRSREMAAIINAAESSLAGHGQTICLVGEPGVGKSRLVHEAVDELQKTTWRVIAAACDPISESAPYGAVKAILHQCLQHLVPEAETLGAKIKHPALGLPPLWQAALHAVLDLAIADDSWRKLEPGRRGRAIADATRAVIETAILQGRSILLVEDVHWIDAASAEILGWLAALGARRAILTLYTSRPGPAADWLDRHEVTRLWVPPLDALAGTMLLDALLGSLPLLSPLKQRILGHTGRIPLFIEEVCRDLVDRHGPTDRWGGATVAALLDDLGVPPTIQGVIAQRIDRLDLDVRAVLQLAATAGSRMTVSLLRAAGNLPEDDLVTGLDRLDKAGLLVEGSLLPTQSFEFRHDLVRLVAYESMVEARRVALHSAILAALEAEIPDDGEDRSALMSHHAVKAQAWPKAYCYARKAAQGGLARSAFSEAARHFGTAMDALDRTPHSVEREAASIDLRIEARLAFSGSGRVDRRQDLSIEAERRALAIGDEARRVAALAIRVSALTLCGIPGEAIALGREARDGAERLADHGWLTSAEYALGLALYHAGRSREAAELAGLAYQRLSGPDPVAPAGTSVPTLTLLCCLLKTAAHTALGEFDHAERFERRAQAIAAGRTRPLEQIAAACASGIYLLGRGAPEKARDRLEPALSLARTEEILLYLPVVAGHLGAAYLALNLPELAVTVLDEAQIAAEAVGYTWASLRASTLLGMARAQCGDTVTGLALIRRARDTARQQGFEGQEAEALRAEADILAAGLPSEEVA
ncbi:MAG: AAA family ATPase [Aliidongia sp.]